MVEWEDDNGLDLSKEGNEGMGEDQSIHDIFGGWIYTDHCDKLHEEDVNGKDTFRLLPQVFSLNLTFILWSSFMLLVLCRKKHDNKPGYALQVRKL